MQHCGRRDDHPSHEHTARKRLPVVTCVCLKQRCECPEPVVPFYRERELFHCKGTQHKEGAPPHLPVVVGL